MEEYWKFISRMSDAYKECKFVRATFDEQNKILEVVLVYPEDFLFTVEMKKDLYDLTKKYVDDDTVDIRLAIKKSYLDCDVIRNFIIKYIKKNRSALSSTLQNEDIQIDIKCKDVEITVFAPQSYVKYLNDIHFDSELLVEMNKIFFGNINIRFEGKKEEINDDPTELLVELNAEEEIDDEKIYYDLTDLNVIIGSKLEPCAIAISCLKPTMVVAQICGKINFYAEKFYKTKKLDENGNPVMRKFYTFSLKDTTGSVHCSVFENKSNADKLAEITDGMEVTIVGDIDTYNDAISVKVKDISTCKFSLHSTPNELSEYKNIRDKYLFVSPDKYESKTQVDIFSMFEDVHIPPFLQANDVVVYDLETTGLNPDADNIIEIGAVKIHVGSISETFTTLINPKMPIPADVTKVNNITNEMVRDKLTIDKILPDFMKFIDGCIIAGYNNTGFDDKFLKRVCKKYKYRFDNRSIDVLNLARLNVPGAKNYKLITIADKLGIILDNAHRALFDTIATAEVLIKLADHIN